MSPLEIVKTLLERDQEPVDEATVRRPNRGSRYLAVYTGVEPGTQVARSTGLTDERAARDLARKWEVQAREERVRRKAEGTLGREFQSRQNASLTQAEIAAILGLSERAVRTIEKRALIKLRRHPLLRAIWAEHMGSPPVEEDSFDLTPQDIAALFGLARSPIERHAILKVLILIWADA